MQHTNTNVATDNGYEYVTHYSLAVFERVISGRGNHAFNNTSGSINDKGTHTIDIPQHLSLYELNYQRTKSAPGFKTTVRVCARIRDYGKDKESTISNKMDKGEI